MELKSTHDICDLETIDICNVASFLEERFSAGMYYTMAKEVLVFVNPYLVHTIPSNAPSTKDISAAALLQLDKLRINLEAAHDVFPCWRTADICRQTIIITGESGAGKTESMKILLAELMAPLGTNACQDGQTKHAMQANLIMEAFGNAKTVRNENSSRYGKLMKICQRPKDLSCSLFVETYLLEKCRVSGRSIRTEGNFHIFHKVLQSEMERPDNSPFVHTYRYLQMEDTEKVHFGYQEFHLSDVIVALKECLAFSNCRIEALLAVVRGILNLGQVTFSDGEETVFVEAHEHAASLLGLDANTLVSSLTTVTLRDEIKITCSAHQAIMTTDALANSLYAQLFDLIVGHINAALNIQGVSSSGEIMEINILDMFGFENLAYNGLEQLLINYANEVLHRIYLQEHIMHLQEEYREEGIECVVPIHLIDASTVDNQIIIDCIEHPCSGVFSLLHEQSLLLSRDQQLQLSNNGATNRFTVNLLSKLHSSTLPSFNQVLQYNKLTRRFHINHFASNVAYTADEMLARNCFVNLSRFDDIMSSSTNEIVREMYLNPVIASSNSAASRAPATSANATICKTFKQQIQLLLQTVGCPQSENAGMNKLYYLKCIKSNDVKRPLFFDHQYVRQQVQYSGSVPAASIDKICFAYKQAYASFFDAFALLFKNALVLSLADVGLALQQIGLSAHNCDYALGKTFIYVSKAGMQKLQLAIDSEVYKNAVSLQRMARGYLKRRRYRFLLARIVELQCAVRCFFAKKVHAFLRLRYNSNKIIQSFYRMSKLRKWYNLARKCVSLIQKRFRQQLYMKRKAKLCSDSASLIQINYRRYRASRREKELRCLSVMKIQAAYRRYMSLILSSATKLQRIYRAHLVFRRRLQARQELDTTILVGLSRENKARQQLCSVPFIPEQRLHTVSSVLARVYISDSRLEVSDANLSIAALEKCPSSLLLEECGHFWQVFIDAWRKTAADVLERIRSHRKDAVFDFLCFANVLYLFSVYLYIFPLD
eukprot:gene30683-37076_t